MHEPGRVGAHCHQHIIYMQRTVGLALRERLGVGTEVADGLAELEALLLSLGLGLLLVEAHEGHLRVREAGGRHRVVVHLVRPALDVLHRRHALRGVGD